MARLSGLASEHHPSGPGDAPRRKRGRKSQTPSVDMAAGTKRAASPSVEVQTTKRSKRVQVDDHDQLTRELEESVSRSQASDTIQVASTSTRRERRRYSEPPAAANDDDEENELADGYRLPATQPVDVRPPKTSRRARMSMPAELHVTNIDETDGVKQVQFSPFRAVLDRHSKSRLRRNHLSEEMNDIEDHKKQDAKLRKMNADLQRKIKDLEYQLEASRMGNIDMSEDQTAELQEQLDTAQQEIEDLRASFDAGDDLDGDDDALMLIHPDEIGLTQEQMEASPHPNGPYASRALASSQITVESLTTLSQTTQDLLAQASQVNTDVVPDRISDQAVMRYESEIDQLTRKVADFTSGLRVLTIELQNLHIVKPGASATEILAELRHVLEDSREQYEQLFPGQLDSLTNADFIRKVMNDLNGINLELLEKTVLSEKQHQTLVAVEAEYNGTLNLLSDSEARIATLAEKQLELEATNADHVAEIGELNTRLTTMHDVAEEKDELIRQQDASINGLKDELEDKDTDRERLSQALESYRTEVQKLTDTVTRLEQEHEARITEMQEEHTAIVEDLQNQLNNETEDRAVAEEDAQQKATYIDQLEEKLVNLDNEVNEITTKMTELVQLHAQETASREAVEIERDEQAAVAYDHANTIENLHEQIEELQQEVTDFKTNLAAERAQREQTEAELDEANEKIENLNSQVHTQGIAANELRGKLYELQEREKQAIAKLNEEAAAEAQEHEEVLVAETERRQIAEQDVATLEAQVTSLQTELTTVENALEETTLARNALEVDRDEQVTNLTLQLEDLRQKYTALEASSTSTIDTLQATIKDLTNEVHGLRATVRDLENAAVEATEAHVEEIAERNEVITELENDLNATRKENAMLATENKSLEKRVENEATELLNIMSAHAEETNGLRQAINSQNGHIANLRQAAEQAKVTHEAQVVELEQELEERRIMGESRAGHIIALEAALEEIKKRFAEQVAQSQATIDALVETNRQTLVEQEALAVANKKRDQDALSAVLDMKIQGLEVKTHGAKLDKVVNGKVTKVSERVKVSKKKSGAGRLRSGGYRDSGFVEPLDDEELSQEGMSVVTDEGIVG